MYHTEVCWCADPDCQVNGCKAQKQDHPYLNFPPIGSGGTWVTYPKTDMQRVAELEHATRELKQDVQMLRQQNEELRAENSRLKSGQEEYKLEAQHLANYAAESWDRFLQKHEDELVNLRRISKERKAEVAELNQKLADAQQELLTFRQQLSKAKWVEDSLRFEIDILNSALEKSEEEKANPMREIRQAHQEADQWQRRCEEAQAKLEVVTAFLNELRDDLQFHADDVGCVMANWELEAEEIEPQFKPVQKTFISGQEIDAATDRHWRERDK